MNNQSEVARLLAQVDAEYQAGRRALTDPALGAAMHEFISIRMERIGKIHEELGPLVGGMEPAMALIAQHMGQ